MILKQFSCIEGQKVDMRQAKAILKYKPDIVIQEAPSHNGKADSIFNKYSVKNKPVSELEKINKNLKFLAEKYPWYLSDVYTYENISQLWKLGKNTQIYNVDGPSELLQETIIHKWNTTSPHRRGTHLVWWVYIFLREKIMTEYISKILLKNKNNKDLIVLVLMQKFHWLNVQFQLAHPKKDVIWNYYFGKFENLKPKDVEEIIKKENATLYKYWKKLKIN
ncbi:MAG: hypothetical protein WCK48_03300 [bacterium]